MDLLGNFTTAFLIYWVRILLTVSTLRTPSQRRGVITLIPKEDSDLYSLANWHLITLLNVDYKIVSKVITKRLEKVLMLLINPDQTGFIKGRYIGKNIRLINDILEQTKLRNIPGILLQLDFQKAFDTIEWEFILKTIVLFNFGESIQRFPHFMSTQRAQS